mgnify:CR=1 FL=1
MKKICKSNFITRNRDKLPKSWANLYALVNIDEDDLQGFVDDGVVTTETTKKQIMEIREKIEPPINEDEFENLMDETNSELIEDSNDGTDDILLFTGLGSTFYTNICGDSSSDAYNNVDLGEGFNRDGTVFKCTIQSDSLLDYNKIAVNEYYAGGSTEIKDAMLPFKFYENMDQGGNVSEDVGAPINTVYFCDDAIPLYTPEPTSDDLKLSDCEILSYLTNPGF